MRKHCRTFACLLVLCGSPTVALSADQDSTSKAQPPRTQAHSGAQVYVKVCRHCHETGVGPALLGRSLPPQLITVFVRNGAFAMPAFRTAEIDDATLAQVADYISKN